MKLICWILGHRYEIWALNGRSKWCRRCNTRIDVPPHEQAEVRRQARARMDARESRR